MVTISIITPALNRAELIARAVESVRTQSYAATEHIVIDGGSNDGTIERLAAYSDLDVVSERDDGLYDALDPSTAVAPPSMEAIRQEAIQILSESYLQSAERLRLAMFGFSSILRFRRAEGF